MCEEGGPRLLDAELELTRVSSIKSDLNSERLKALRARGAGEFSPLVSNVGWTSIRLRGTPSDLLGRHVPPVLGLQGRRAALELLPGPDRALLPARHLHRRIRQTARVEGGLVRVRCHTMLATRPLGSGRAPSVCSPGVHCGSLSDRSGRERYRTVAKVADPARSRTTLRSRARKTCGGTWSS